MTRLRNVSNLGLPRLILAFTPCLLGFVSVGCSANSGGTSDAGGTGGTGGTESTGSGGNTGASTPLFARSECGTIAPSDLAPSTSTTAPASFALGQLVGGRIDPASTSNREHQWVVQLAAGFYHLVVDSRTADGTNGNIGIQVTRRPDIGSEERLLSGNEIARRYRDEAFFEVKTAALVPLKVISNFGMEDYLMGVFANGTPVPSPAFDKCPTVMPLALGQPTPFTVGPFGTDSGEQWFLVDFKVGNYKFLVDATLTSGVSGNLAYQVDVMDQFGQDSRAKRIVSDNQIGVHFTAGGMLAVGETGSYWVRLHNGFGGLDVTMTVSPQ